MQAVCELKKSSVGWRTSTIWKWANYQHLLNQNKNCKRFSVRATNIDILPSNNSNLLLARLTWDCRMIRLALTLVSQSIVAFWLRKISLVTYRTSTAVNISRLMKNIRNQIRLLIRILTSLMSMIIMWTQWLKSKVLPI